MHDSTPLSQKPVANTDPGTSTNDFQQAIIQWFDQTGRSYPWRETTDPYAILVSEIMLQQTRIATVLDRQYYHRWMVQFPDVNTLAEAEEDAILKAWEGLGYYRRARNLHKLAKEVVANYEGRMPNQLTGLLALPGIGRYTAGAVSSFAYNKSAPIVDGNVARVFARLFDFHAEIDSSTGQKQLWAWAEDLVPSTNPRAYNSGIMELGQRLCTQKNPNCAECPVNDFCQAAEPDMLPNKTHRRATVIQDEHVLFARQHGRILLAQEQGKRRQGLWKLPERPLTELGESGANLVYKAKYAITHYRVTLHAHSGTSQTRDGETWHPIAKIPDLAMPAPYRKAMDHLLSEADDFSLKG